VTGYVPSFLTPLRYTRGGIEDAHYIPECPAIYEIRYHFQRGGSFDLWLRYEFNLNRHTDGEGGGVIPIVRLWVLKQPYLGKIQRKQPRARP